MAEIEDRYYSMPEIMKYLGINRDTDLHWIAAKKCHYIRVEIGENLRSPRSTNGSTATKRSRNYESSVSDFSNTIPKI